MWDYSPEKLDLIFELAHERKTREQAVEDMRAMRNFRAAYASNRSEEGKTFYNAEISKLIKLAGFKDEKEKKKADTKSNRRNLAAKLKGMGAKVKKNG